MGVIFLTTTMKKKGRSFMALRPIKPDLQLALVVCSALIFQTLTFPDYYLIGPFSNSPIEYMSGTQLLWLVGWAVFVFAPPFLVVIRARVGMRYSLYLAIAASIWPLVVVVFRVFEFVSTGDPTFAYLVDHPVFVFSDIVVPALYLGKANHAAILNRRVLSRLQLSRLR